MIEEAVVSKEKLWMPGELLLKTALEKIQRMSDSLKAEYKETRCDPSTAHCGGKNKIIKGGFNICLCA